ncbi:MAG: electron transport complex subunit RsxC [Lachnospiraceae bacterium]
MKLATFKGGIHPFEGKELAEEQPIKKVVPTTAEMVFPLSQHIGAPATPIVKPGECVLVGQKIAEATGFVSSPVISSVSGKVKSIEERTVAAGSKVRSIVIINDNQYTPIEGMGTPRDYKTMSANEIRTAIKDAGIVGLGGAGFPTQIKVTPKDSNAIDYVIVNAAECEPYLTSDYRLMLEQTEKIIGGLRIELSLFPNAKGIIGIESNKPKAIAKFEELLKDDTQIRVCPLQTKYPQGGERTLIYACTGRKINSTKLPADAGCIVSNTDTVISIYNAVALSTPLIRRIITVTGDAIQNPCNVEVPIGTSYQDVLAAAGGFKETPEKMISGGPMMGMSLYTLDIPVTKNSSTLLAMTHDEVAACEPSPCIRCGRCATVCPSNLVPQIMMSYAERGDLEGFTKVNGMECVECGCCTYVCPAKRNLTQSFKQMRRAVAASRRKK